MINNVPHRKTASFHYVKKKYTQLQSCVDCMSGIKRLIYKSTKPGATARSDSLASEPISSQRSALGNDETVGEYLADLLGVRGAFVVEENEYMRDKMYHMGTFGFGAKKGISDSYNLHDTRVGSVWKPRILIVTHCSICLFALKGKKMPKELPLSGSISESEPNGAPVSPVSSIRTLGDMGDRAGGQLLNMCADLRVCIPMEDVQYISEPMIELMPNDFLIKIQRTLVTGLLTTTVLRLRSREKHDDLMNILEISLRSYRSALDALQKGVYDEKQSMNLSHSVRIICAQDGDEPERLVTSNGSWNQSFNVACRQDTKITVQIHGYMNDNYVATVVPYMLRRGTKSGEPIWVKAVPSVDDGDMKAISVQLAVKEASAGSSISPSKIPTEKAVVAAVKASEPLITYSMKETTSIFMSCLIVAILYVIPESYITRDSLMTAMIIPVFSIMLISRGLRKHQATLAPPSVPDQPTATATPNASVNMGMVTYTIAVLGAEDDLVAGVMDPEETEEAYVLNHSSTRRNSCFSAINVVTPSCRDLHKKENHGVDALISALDGADRVDTIQDSEVPQKWLDATDGNMHDALRQWRDSLRWRRDNDIDNVLTKPQPLFFKIKTLFPHLWFGLDKTGNLVTLERFGEMKKNIKDLIKEGITAEDFAAHCVFLNEYWIKNRLTETGRLNKIVDLKGFGLSQLTSEVMNYLKPMNAAMQQYPELLIKVYIINVPSSFKWMWKIVSPFLAKKTTEKFHIIQNADKVKETLVDVIPTDVIFPEYGGTNTTDPRYLPLEIQTANYVRTLNRNNNVVAEMDWDTNASSEPAMLDSIPVKTPGDDIVVTEVLDTLVGTWLPDPKSDSMDAVLELQGVNELDRKAAESIPVQQSIQITGPPKERHFEVVTKAGPVQTAVGGVLGSSNTTKCDNDEICTVKACDGPANIVDSLLNGKCVMMVSTLKNGDSRTIIHGITKSNVNEKVMIITYEQKSSGKSETITLYHSRKHQSSRRISNA